MNIEILIKNGTVVSASRGFIEANLAISGGKIVGVISRNSVVKAERTIDATGKYILPGGIDPHTHWGNYGTFAEDCYKESRNAAIGGTTSSLLFQRVAPDDGIVDPGRAANIPFDAICEIGRANSVVDFGITPIIHDERSASMIPELIKKRGCSSFKFYLAYRDLKRAPKGDDWNKIDDGMLLEMFQDLGRRGNMMACVHAENAEIINHALELAESAKKSEDDLAAWERANPAIAEAEAVLRAGFFAESAKLPLYAVHMSGKAALDALRRARAVSPYVYGETCIHYLFHSCETSPASVKFSPPIRYQSDQDALWDALSKDEISCVASDSVCTPHTLKSGGVWNVARGAPCAGVVLPALLSEGVSKGRISLQHVVRVTSQNAARLFGLWPRKGNLDLGADADLIIVDMEKSQKVGDVFPEYEDYADHTFKGWPILTMVGGRIIVEDHKVVIDSAHGQYLPRNKAQGSGHISGDLPHAPET